MKIVFISNYFTHHQKPLSDALFNLTGGEYLFLATEKMSDDRKSQGWTVDLPDYVHELDMSDSNAVKQYTDVINNADAVIQGHLYDVLVEARIASGKLTFIYNERLYKSPKRYLKLPMYYYKGIKQRSCYILTASAFTAYDYSLTRSYLGRCFKFGYFPIAKKYSIQELIDKKDKFCIIWVARMIDWKHPEVPFLIAKRLRDEGYKFILKMIGTGDLLDRYKNLAMSENLQDYIMLTGAIKPEQVREEMENAGIMLFTSDRNEGWGAVLNEAMNSGCAVVASHVIGAVPYLLKNNKNGIVYRDGDIEDAYHKIKALLDNTGLQGILGLNAYHTIANTWNADKAAANLLTLIDNLQNSKVSIPDGPCSPAEIIKDNWNVCQ